MDDELITWEEAEWTRQALGMSCAYFARLLGVKASAIYHGQKHPQTFLRPQTATMLKLAVNRLRPRGLTQQFETDD